MKIRRISSIWLVLALVLLMSITLIPAYAQGSLSDACTLTTEMADGQGRFSVSGLGRFSVSGLGRFSVSGLEGPDGSLDPGDGGLTQEQIDEIKNNEITPQWIANPSTSPYDAISPGVGFYSVDTTILVVDDFFQDFLSVPFNNLPAGVQDELAEFYGYESGDNVLIKLESHGQHVAQVMNELNSAIITRFFNDTSFFEFPIDVQNVNIGGPNGYRLDNIVPAIQQAVTNLVNPTFGDPTRHIVINMSFGLIPCEDESQFEGETVAFNFAEFLETREAQGQSGLSFDVDGHFPEGVAPSFYPNYGIVEYFMDTYGFDQEKALRYLLFLLTDPQFETLMQDLKTLLQIYLLNSCNVGPCAQGDLDNTLAIVPVAASGNFRDLFTQEVAPPLAPARWQETIAVSASLGEDGPLWEYSQDGNIITPGAWYNFYAPFSSGGSGEEFRAGTSFSAPYTSMLLGLYLTYPNACIFDGFNPPLNNTDPATNLTNPTFFAGPLACMPLTQNNPSIVDAEFEALAGTDPLDIIFDDRSENVCGQGFWWQIETGDAVTPFLSGNYNPGSDCTPMTPFTYSQGGLYQATLRIFDGGALVDSDSLSFELSETSDPVIAALDATPGAGTAPLLVTFTDNSQNAVGEALTWLLEYGDGSSDTGAYDDPAFSPIKTHTYNSAGQFTATLSISDSSGVISTATATIMVDSPVAGDPPVASLDSTPDNGLGPLDVTHTDNSSNVFGQGYTFTLDFGDGGSVSGAYDNPGYSAVQARQYLPGVYTATLRIFDGATELSSDSNQIMVTAPICDAATGDPQNDLKHAASGIFTPGVGTVVNNSPLCAYEVGLAAYLVYDNNIDDQVPFSDPDLGIVQPGESLILTVALPTCAYQVDLFYGDYLSNLDGQRYGERLIDADHRGAPLCTRNDGDGDGVQDWDDNCPIVANPDQTDANGNQIGDACEASNDGDNDGVNDDDDNCPATPNPGQADSDNDGSGDACDDDDDNDNVPDATDNCLLIANPGQEDFDGDTTGDACDNDDDNDGVLDSADQCPETPPSAVVNPDTGCTIGVVGTGVVRVTLQWDNTDDLDLWVIEPDGFRIFYGDRQSPSGGELDVDSYPLCASIGNGIENIFYPADSTPDQGTYTVVIDLFASCEQSVSNWTLQIRFNDIIVFQESGMDTYKEFEFTVGVGGGNRRYYTGKPFQCAATTVQIETRESALSIKALIISGLLKWFRRRG